MKLALMDVMNQEFVEALENPKDEKYAYLADTLAWISERKLPGLLDTSSGYAPGEGVNLWPVGVLPTKEHLYDRMYANPKYIELHQAAYEYLSGYIDANRYVGSLAFFFFVTPTTVGRIRLRVPRTKDFIAIDDEYNDEVGLFGLNSVYYMRQLSDQQKYLVLGIEGEIDQLSVYANQVVRGETDIVPLATGGGMTPSLESLSVFGIDRIAFAPDKDSGGDGCARRLIQDGHIGKIFTWTDEDYSTPQYKDIDGAVRFHGYDMMRERLLSQDSYFLPHEWMHRQLTRDLMSIPSNDIRAKTRRAGELGTYLSNVSERRAYVAAVAEQIGVEPRVINRDMPLEINTQGDLVECLRNRLEEEYFVLFQGTGGSDRVTLWNRNNKVARELRFASKRHVAGLLAMDLGNLQEFVEDEFGVPAYIAYSQTTKGPLPTDIMKQEKLIEQAFMRSLDGMIKDAPMKENLTELGQGIHYIPNFDRGKPAVLIANGTKFFHGTVHNDRVTYEALDKPIAGQYYLKASQMPWSSFINSVDDLQPESVLDYDLARVITKVHELFSEGWKFKHPDTDSWYLAADTVYTTIASVFGHMTMTELSGDTHSGKTKLMQVIGGQEREIQDIRLCEAVESMDNFSEAAIRHARGGSPLRLMLDEFENRQGGYDTSRNRAVQNTLVSIRRLSAGSVVVRGSADGTPIRCELHFPLTVAGIHATEEAYDVNRFVKVALAHEKGRQDPYERVRQLITQDEMVKLRREITLGLLCKLPQVHDTYCAIREEFMQNVGLPAGLDSRLKDNLLPGAAMLKLADLDYKKYLAAACRNKMTFLEKFGATVREHESLWREVFRTPISLRQHSPDSVGMTSIAKMIGEPQMYTLLNGLTDLGVYYIPDNKWLLVFWERALLALLQHSRSYKFVTNPGQLKSTAENDPHVIKQTVLESSNFLPQACRLIGSRVNYGDISVYDVEDVLLEDGGVGIGFSPELGGGMGCAPDDDVTDADMQGNFDELTDGTKKEA